MFTKIFKKKSDKGFKPSYLFIRKITHGPFTHGDHVTEYKVGSMLHRMDGPAVSHYYEQKIEWWIYNIELTREYEAI